MSKLDELIKKLCPDGVEYKRLGEIGTSFYRGSGIKRDDITPDGIPCVRYGEIYTTYHVAFSRCISHTQNQNLAKSKFFSHGDILFAITGESVADIAKSCAYLGNEDCLAGGDILVMKHEQNPKYIAYALETNDARKQKSKGKIKSKVVHASVQSIKDIVIPVPPLEVQSEIVKILDNFTELTTELTMELTTELTARKKQYEYYRNRLLTFESKDISLFKLQDVVEIQRGIRVTRNQLSNDGKYPVYQNSLVPMGYYNDKNREANSTFLICAGAAGDIGYSTQAFWAADDCYTFDCSDKILNRYLFYVLKNKQALIYSKVRRASVPRISKESVGTIKVPVPEISVQERIVNVLDNFDKVCNDLHIGLPAEIEARKKQYKFYRDSLLTFLEKGESILTEQNRTELRYALIKLLQYVFGYVTVEIGEVCQLITGATPDTKKNEYWEDGDIPWLSSGEVSKKRIKSTDSFITELGYKNASTTLVPPQTVVIALAGQGKTRGKVAITEIELCTNQSLCSMVCGNLILPEYLYFYLDGKYEHLRAISNGDGTRGGLSLRLLRPYKMPLPSLEVQNRIVVILRRFEQLINDISSGLPAEIEARKKQYEYYRDKLLSFKEKKG